MPRCRRRLRKPAWSLFEPPAPLAAELPESAVGRCRTCAQTGRLADRFYGSPSNALHMIGVTGTNGKTSIVQLIAQAYACWAGRRHHRHLGVGCTASCEAGERTTPDVIAVHKAAGRHAGGRRQAVAMEVSSHALDQGRVDEVAFDTAVFSNLTRTISITTAACRTISTPKQNYSHGQACAMPSSTSMTPMAVSCLSLARWSAGHQHLFNRQGRIVKRCGYPARSGWHAFHPGLCRRAGSRCFAAAGPLQCR